ncbi:MAG: peptidase M3, partial [Spirochaetales bacterium]
IMIECQKKTYGEGLDENFLHPYMWAVKGHYYSTGFSFYNYPYAFGQLFGLGLYNRSAKQDKGNGQERPFYEKYNELLSLTGQLPAEDVAATAGIDITDSAFWQEGMDIIASYAKELETFAGK